MIDLIAWLPLALLFGGLLVGGLVAWLTWRYYQRGLEKWDPDRD